MFKGFASYREAHSVWHDFVEHGILPSDVIASLFDRPPPVPPTIPQCNIGGLDIPPSPTTGTIGSPRMPSLRPSFGSLANPPSPTTPGSHPMPVFKRQASGAGDGDFWVVLSGASPGVYLGRWVVFNTYLIIIVKCHFSQEGERALGPLASPSCLRVGSREEANQIFVDEYMRLRVARFT